MIFSNLLLSFHIGENKLQKNAATHSSYAPCFEYAGIFIFLHVLLFVNPTVLAAVRVTTSRGKTQWSPTKRNLLIDIPSCSFVSRVLFFPLPYSDWNIQYAWLDPIADERQRERELLIHQPEMIGACQKRRRERAHQDKI